MILYSQRFCVKGSAFQTVQHAQHCYRLFVVSLKLLDGMLACATRLQASQVRDEREDQWRKRKRSGGGWPWTAARPSQAAGPARSAWCWQTKPRVAGEMSLIGSTNLWHVAQAPRLSVLCIYPTQCNHNVNFPHCACGQVDT